MDELNADMADDYLNNLQKQMIKKGAKENMKYGGDTKLFLNYELRDLFINEDGSITLVAEYYNMWLTSSTSGSTSDGYTRSYVNGNILIVKITSEGKIVWQLTLKGATFGGTPQAAGLGFYKAERIGLSDLTP